MSDLIDLLETTFFQSGLRSGILALVGCLVLTAVIRRPRPLPIGGLLIFVAVVAAFWRLEELGREPVLAIGVVLAGVAIGRLIKLPDAGIALASVPGAVWLALGVDPTGVAWAPVATAVLIPVGGYLVSDFEKRHAGLGLGVVFYTLAALGVFAAVPDTEWALVLAAVTVPVSLLAWPQVRISLGVEGAYVSLAVFCLITIEGGFPRPASIVGGLACLGLLLIEPVVIRLWPEVVRITSWPRRDWRGALVAAVPQLLFVIVCSRIAARFTNEPPALLVVVLACVVTAAIAVSASRNEVDSRAG